MSTFLSYKHLKQVAGYFVTMVTWYAAKLTATYVHQCLGRFCDIMFVASNDILQSGNNDPWKSTSRKLFPASLLKLPVHTTFYLAFFSIDFLR